MLRLLWVGVADGVSFDWESFFFQNQFTFPKPFNTKRARLGQPQSA